MIIPIVYTGIIVLSIYVAVVGDGYVVALAFVVGGIAFFFLQRYFYRYLAEMEAEHEANSDSEDDDNNFRLPPA